MNDDLTERAYAPRRSLATLAALVVVLKNIDTTEQNPLTGDYPSYSNVLDANETSPTNAKEMKCTVRFSGPPA